ncbi:MAG: phosphoribosylformylglycinamidine synthase [Clostridiaceae bacterium]
MGNIRTLFVEKRNGFNLDGEDLLKDFRENLGIKGLKGVRLINRYDFILENEDDYNQVKNLVLSEVNVDDTYDEKFPVSEGDKYFSLQYLPGQFDQRADSARQIIEILTGKDVEINSAKVVVLSGDINETDIEKIKGYYINNVDSMEISIEKPESLSIKAEVPNDVKVIENFIDFNDSEIEAFLKENGLAMAFEDLKFVQEYFKNSEKRNPTVTEIKVIDTYWSDHCRHTTFSTILDKIEIEEGSYSEAIKMAYNNYLEGRSFVYTDRTKDITLMDMATLGMKELRKKGLLEDLDVSDEINACSINITVDIDGKDEEWLLMFKNETHNHPTEIEPFGGAATCIGGAIRDPLSGRTYVYQAMRVSGSGDPRVSVSETISGKLPQRTITRGAANGYSSYGNQIGLATGQVAEIYHEGYIAKRLELGAVIAAAPKENVVRRAPKAGDVIILLGGRTGRDGCGGATGSSKEHTETSINTCSSEVQKGNAPTERKIQRLFRNPEVSQLIVKCNDFGAGGVSVAIGELADALEINLDLVPKKYDGLDGTELSISESQERMAVVIDKCNTEKFLELCSVENLEAVEVAVVTDDNRMKMQWRGKTIVNLSRDFLNTNGVTQNTEVYVTNPSEDENYFKTSVEKSVNKDTETLWNDILTDLNVCSQRGLIEKFDSSIGAGTVLMPFGGKKQGTPTEGMVGKIPVLKGNTNTCSIMTYGYNPYLTTWSPFHGGIYSVIEAVTKVVALGGDYKKVRLSLQEYFERLGKDKISWGKPFSALLGAYYMQKTLNVAAIGGKDSMSGTFKDMKVPPTIVTFAVTSDKVDNIVSQEFKNADSKVVLVKHVRLENDMPNLELLKANFEKVRELILKGVVLSSNTVKVGGVVEAVSKMTFGNSIGIKINDNVTKEELVAPNYGSIVLEISSEADLKELFGDVNYIEIGNTVNEYKVIYKNTNIDLNTLEENWEKVLEKVFPTQTEKITKEIPANLYNIEKKASPVIKIAKPKVFIPVFPGTNCEYDTAKAFEEAGAEADVFVFRNGSKIEIEDSIKEIVKRINSSQMIMLSGGFSAGDEPDGSGKFVAGVFRDERIKNSVHELLRNRDGLMLGICNGFQALIKLGLVPYGEIRDLDVDSPTLTYNKIGRHISRMVNTKVTSNLSPWLYEENVGDVHSIAVSHGEGRFFATEEVARKLMENGQISTQYVDFSGNPTYEIEFNPNGSVWGIEGICSPDGRVLGKMGHSERKGYGVAKNIPGNKYQSLFTSGVNYYK